MTSFAVLASAVLGAPLAARAQVGAGAPASEAPLPGDAKAAKEQALKLDLRAQDLYGAGRKAEAVDLLRAAWAVDKDWNYPCTLGNLLVELGRAREAAESLSTCIRVVPKEAALFKTKAERSLKKVRVRLVSVMVTANVPGAEIFVDGQPAGKTPLEGPLYVEPGERLIEVRAPGYEANGRLIVSEAGGSMKVQLTLERAEPDTERVDPEKAPIPLKTPETAATGTHVAVPPPAPPVSPPAPPATNQDTIAEKEPETLRIALLVAGFGVAALGTGLGTASFLSAAEKHREAVTLKNTLDQLAGIDPCSNFNNLVRCKEILRADTAAEVYIGLGIGNLVVATASGAVAVYELARSRAPIASPRPQASIAVMPGGGAIVVTGSF